MNAPTDCDVELAPQCGTASTQIAPTESASRVGFGTWLDEDIRLSGDEGALLLKSALLKLNATPRRRDYRKNFERRVECVLANALRAHFYRESDRVAYLTGNNDYHGRVEWLSGSGLRSTITLMAEAGLIGAAKGKWGGLSFGKGYAATYWLDQSLREMMAHCQVTLRTVGKPVPPVSSLIKLRAGGDEGKRLLPFDPTEETDSWVGDLDRYNRFADQHEVHIAALCTTTEKKLLAGWNAKLAKHSKQPGLVEPEFFNRHLHRIFNDGTFEHGGRLYGAWYQYAPDWMRPRILIEDCDTAELDYSGMAVRMLYHLKGVPCDEDPYGIPELEAHALATGRDPKHFRDAIKSLAQAMLNNENDDRDPEMIDLDVSFRPKYTRAQVRDMILKHHQPIDDMFGTGVGKALQRLESDIALEVIVSLMDEGILCLPIHDSFRVIETHKERLQEQMVRSYEERLGFKPIIRAH